MFDLSKPEEGVKHLGHLEFEGWIQRSFPLSYKGKDYILGLGMIVPSVDNESGKRHPQARLFEVKKLSGGKVKAVDVADLTFKDANVWIQLNNQDKFVELRLTDAEKGQGVIMFAVDQYTENRYVSGGKLISFDLSKAEDADVFTEGGLLAGEWGWLRRVFTNSEIDKVNTFSDEALGTFDAVDPGTAATVFNAVSILELARNIEAYVTLKDKVGLQIVTKGQAYSWTDSVAKTELRLVSSDKADSEKANVLASVEVEGAYKNHLVTDQGLLVATQSYSKVKVEDGDGNSYDSYEPNAHVYLVKLDDAQKPSVAAKATWKIEATLDDGFTAVKTRRGRVARYFPTENLRLVRLNSGEILVTSGSQDIRVLNVGGELSQSPVGQSTCELKDAREVVVNLIDGVPYLSWYLRINKEGQVLTLEDDASRDNDSAYAKNYVSEVKLEKNAEGKPSLTCVKAVNVPGKPYAVKGESLVTEDVRLLDEVKHVQKGQNGNPDYVYTESVTRTNLSSLKLSDVATLVDQYDPSISSASPWFWRFSLRSSFQKVDGNSFIFFENEEGQNRSLFSRLSVDKDFNFVKSSRLVDLGQRDAGASLVTVIPVADAKYLGVVRSDRHIYVVNFDLSEQRPVKVELRKVNAQFGLEEKSDSVLLPNPWAYYWNDSLSSIDFDASANRLNFAQGLYGVSQVELVK